MTSNSPNLIDANQSLADSAANAVSQAANQARPIIKRATDQASALANQGLDAWNSSKRQVVDRAHQASDNTVSYIKDKPYTSVLIAAAGGAALMAVAALLTRSRYRD